MFNTERYFSKISECIKRSSFGSTVDVEARTRKPKLKPIILNRRQGLGSGKAGGLGPSTIPPHLFAGGAYRGEKALSG